MLHQTILEQLKKPVIKNSQKVETAKKPVYLDRLQAQEKYLRALYDKKSLTRVELDFLAKIYDQFNGNSELAPPSAFSSQEKQIINDLIDWIEKVVDKQALKIQDMDITGKFLTYTVFVKSNELSLQMDEEVEEVNEKTAKLRKNSLFSLSNDFNEQAHNASQYNMIILNR